MKNYFSVFGLGIAVGALTFYLLSSREQPKQVSNTHPKIVSPKLAIEEQVPRHAASDAPQPIRTPANTSLPTPENKIIAQADFEKTMMEAESRADLEKQKGEHIPSGELTSHKENPDGGWTSTEQTATGGVIAKAYSSSGVMTAIEWREANGDFLIKTFFEDGAFKGISAGHGKDARYTLTQTEYGSPTYKEFTLEDGGKLVAKFDPNGRATEQWHVTPDGRWVRIY